MKKIWLLLVLLLAACSTNAPAATSTPTHSPALIVPTYTPSPEAHYAVTVVMGTTEFTGSVSVVASTPQHLECTTVGTEHVTLSSTHNVQEITRDSNCPSNVVMVDLPAASDYTLVLFSLSGETDTLIGANHGLRANGIAPAENGQYVMMPSIEGNRNIVIIAAIPNQMFLDSRWEDGTATDFAAIIESHNEDVCGWARDEVQGLQNLIGNEAVTIWGKLSQKYNCEGFSHRFGVSTPTMQVQPTITPTVNP